MVHYYIMCRSLTYAQRAARILERSGITVLVTRPPQSVSKEGCKYCIKISEKRLTDALRLLKQSGFEPSAIYMQNPGGKVSEVRP